MIRSDIRENMRTSKLFAVVLMAALMAGGSGFASAQTGSFSSLFVFGDSLSDSGNAFVPTGGAIPASPPYLNGRFSNGPIWVEHLAPALGFTFNGATDFAIGGAETGATALPNRAAVAPCPGARTGG